MQINLKSGLAILFNDWYKGAADRDFPHATNPFRNAGASYILLCKKRRGAFRSLPLPGAVRRPGPAGRCFYMVHGFASKRALPV